ncbi:hypothetical protein LSH36_178g04099 [Paralvinella palmiformis]|uniref:Phorbol-ester/DAG-type domain-containing protein n=1 Tax=Paralvinella palmiformis TaxID=53620 RepID=A0AAD9JRE5_9ANNE|nr:hypothetical protein LSH36_178g04099 [Paralvinella palmiformis]
MAAREYVEWMAYQAIEDASVEHQQKHVFRRSRTTIDGGFGEDGGDLSSTEHLAHNVQQRLHVSKTYTDLQNSAEDHARHGVMNNMKKRLSDNFEHYSNIFHEVALPILFRRGHKDRSRSRSRSRDGKRREPNDCGSNVQNFMNGERLVEGDFVFVENIELHHMDGFLFSSRHEIGKGHNFVLVHLRSPSWCDKCGDFIWGISKQCLKCTRFSALVVSSSSLLYQQPAIVQHRCFMIFSSVSCLWRVGHKRRAIIL